MSNPAVGGSREAAQARACPYKPTPRPCAGAFRVCPLLPLARSSRPRPVAGAVVARGGSPCGGPPVPPSVVGSRSAYGRPFCATPLRSGRARPPARRRGPLAAAPSRPRPPCSAGVGRSPSPPPGRSLVPTRRAPAPALLRGRRGAGKRRAGAPPRGGRASRSPSPAPARGLVGLRAARSPAAKWDAQLPLRPRRDAPDRKEVHHFFDPVRALSERRKSRPKGRPSFT